MTKSKTPILQEIFGNRMKLHLHQRRQTLHIAFHVRAFGSILIPSFIPQNPELILNVLGPIRTLVLNNLAWNQSFAISIERVSRREDFLKGNILTIMLTG
jgi:hypothetical protein